MRPRNIYNSHKTKKNKRKLRRHVKKYLILSKKRNKSSFFHRTRKNKKNRGGGTITTIGPSNPPVSSIPVSPIVAINPTIADTSSETPDYNEIILSSAGVLFERFEEYKEGLIYVSIGSSDFGDSQSNAIEQMIPSFLLSNSIQRRTMPFCQTNPSTRTSCKILCLIIDFIAPTDFERNQMLINQRRQNQQIDVVIINLYDLNSSINAENTKQIADIEKVNMLQACCNNIVAANEQFSIEPMKFMCANYAKFRIREELRNQNNISMTIYNTFREKGYSSSVYDWFGYIYDDDSITANEVKKLIYKTENFIESILQNPDNNVKNDIHKTLIQYMNPGIFNRTTRMKTLNELTLNIPPMVVKLLESVYPISEMTLPSGITTFITDNYFTYNLTIFLKPKIVLSRVIAGRQ
jgi:hypothetical protein